MGLPQKEWISFANLGHSSGTRCCSIYPFCSTSCHVKTGSTRVLRDSQQQEKENIFTCYSARKSVTQEILKASTAVLQLVYAPLAGQALSATTFELRNASWNEGRNALLSRAKSMYKSALPLYLIFMDCDVRPAEVPSTSTSRACMHLYTRPLK